MYMSNGSLALKGMGTSKSELNGSMLIKKYHEIKII